MASEFLLTDRRWQALAPLLPSNQPDARRVSDWRVLSGIVAMLRNGGRWQDCARCCRPPTTIHNPYHRWSQRGIWNGMLAALVQATPGGLHLIDSKTAKAHRCAAGGNGGPASKPSAARAAAAGPKSIS